MKKKYSKPSIDVYQISNFAILAGSGDSIIDAGNNPFGSDEMDEDEIG